MKAGRRLLQIGLFAKSISCSTQVIDGSINPSAFSDREALGALFTVVRTRPAPGWDLDTRLEFLQEGGLTRNEAFGMIRAAERWFEEIGPMDGAIDALRAQSVGKQLDKEWQAKADQIAGQKLRRLDSSLADIRLSLAGDGNHRMASLPQNVKRGMKAHVIGTVPPPSQKPHH